MDNPRHRQILRALRPHGADRDDPDAQASLAAAASDPLLARWLEQEQAFDRGFAERIHSVAAPADLRAAIFATVERTASSRPAARRRWVLQRPVATVFAALAAAASLALLAVLVWPRQSRAVALEDIVAAAVELSPASLETTQLAGQPLAEVRDWLATQAAPVPGEIPSGLARLPTDGAAVVHLGGVKASVVTFDAPGFSRDPATGPVNRRLALFTLPRQSCSTAGITREPTVREQGGRALAVWRDATSVYVLAVDAAADDLRRFLAGSRLVVTQATGRRHDPPRPERRV